MYGGAGAPGVPGMPLAGQPGMYSVQVAQGGGAYQPQLAYSVSLSSRAALRMYLLACAPFISILALNSDALTEAGCMSDICFWSMMSCSHKRLWRCIPRRCLGMQAPSTA